MKGLNKCLIKHGTYTIFTAGVNDAIFYGIASLIQKITFKSSLATFTLNKLVL